MKRVSVTIPDELATEARRRLPGLNVSGLLQDALRAALACSHERVACLACTAPLSRRDVALAVLDAFYRDLADALEDLLFSAGTAEGASRVLKTVGLRHQVPLASRRPLPRLTRAERERMARDRHPSQLPEEDAGAHRASA